MDSKKFLVLGGDYGAIEIIKKLHELSYYVIVADYYEETIAKSMADEAWLVSTNDIETLKAKCIENKVDAVITGASDFNVGNARKLCKLLNFPVYCEKDSAWATATNKYLFKQLCKKAGAPIAKDYDVEAYLKDREGYQIDFPVVLKPVDMSANRGMSYCDSKEELDCAIEYARSFSHNEKLICERKLTGKEYAVNYIIANGEPRLFFFSEEHHQRGELANLYSIIITTNYHLKQYLEECNDAVMRVFREAGVTEGVAWVECMLDQDGHFYLLEMGYRFGGEVVNIPYKDVTGFDSIQWMIECALGKKHDPNQIPNIKLNEQRIACSYLLFANKSAVISKIKGLDEIAKMEGVLIDVNKRESQKVSKHLTMGVIRFSADNGDSLCEKIARINELLKIEDENGENLWIHFDTYQELMDSCQEEKVNAEK